MNFNIYFRTSSYAMIAVAMLALAFAVVMFAAWKLEGTKWQLSERVGLVTVLLSVPLFFLDWQYQKGIAEAGDRLGVNALAHLIVFLSAIKLLQVKSDRDWVVLYLISFFEVLLAAGLSFSPVFFVTLSLYLLTAVSTVIALEIRKARRTIRIYDTRVLVPPDSRVFRRLASKRGRTNVVSRRLPLVSLALLVLIFVLALPLFVVAPRFGLAAISRSGGGLTNLIGFSEDVTLGEIGELKRNDEIVMRVRIEDSPPGSMRDFRWRGVALDEFTGRGWKKSAAARGSEEKLSERGFFQLGTTEALHRLTIQTLFREPIDSPVLFAAHRAVAIQGDFPFIRVDGEGSLQSRRLDAERLIYKAFSDTSEPAAATLRKDVGPYAVPFERYLRVPASLDPRIAALATAMIENAHAVNRYDKAKAIESQLQNDYGYTLQMRASGPDPLADFLFHVKAGHCEYFSSAMVVMLRTQGIASRVVNGFLAGEYNEASDAYTVRESDAHSWVEAYFPESNSWVTFDPTPAAGRSEPQRVGLAARLGKYAEAMELMWFQYVVGYDKQQQRSLATTLHNRLFDYRRSISEGINALKKKLSSITREGFVLGFGLILIFVAVVIVKRVWQLGWRRGLSISSAGRYVNNSTIDFYERLIALLAERGMKRALDQTPLEFASATGMREAVNITDAYNRVRYGSQHLSRTEADEIERWFHELEKNGER